MSQSRIEQLESEVVAARDCLYALERMQLALPPHLRNWAGHGELMSLLRLAERALLKAKQDAR